MTLSWPNTQVALLVALCTGAFSCAKKGNHVDSPPAEATTPATTTASATIDAAAQAAPATMEASWTDYFEAFKSAAAARDLKALAPLTLIGADISQETFDGLAANFLTDPVLAQLAKTDAGSIEPSNEEGEAVYEFSWSETYIVDDEELGSGLYFYFKKVDGKFKLFRLLAAG